ncbi:uncharacterized protein Z519_09505 [Cladophialophora bantiana CBS 173.52]|uniref:VOC domain-containing protein n=1 Tax=Cladophialophora bantiana (strain ATCC 10958 / CBS 173.52 / CDC B-1940 / NIH 8579) TaxID=1442370 RepID=A0A0D2HZS0_CLAB1|nr:uncharacterized protein Z519_09505 [Cladophialophora bantiana CBS 173.52]KIW90074.1 hypothetical protein Z519_09505 [Cladophialophora bantiana CBS 173.52]
MSDSEDYPPFPPPGPPFIATSFPRITDDGDTNGYVFNHVALQISSPASSFSFYVDFLGMSLIFALNAGPLTAYYLGYRDAEQDAVPSDMAQASGGRSGLLELIFANDENATQDDSTLNGTAKSRSSDGSRKSGRRTGFAHFGFRVPDVTQTLKRAEEKGWKVMKPLDKVDVHFMPLPGWEHESEDKQRKWEGGFEKVFGQVAFVQDPDG